MQTHDRRSNQNIKETYRAQAVFLQFSKNVKKKSRMLEVQINICPSSFVDKCSTAIISNLSSTDCKEGNIETNETNPRVDVKDPPVDFDNDIEPTSEVKAYTGKSLSEALIFSSNNPHYDNRLFYKLNV